MTLNEAAAVLALLAALTETGVGASRALAELFQARGLDEPARVLIRWAAV